MPDHPGLAAHERHEHADDVQLDEPGHLGVERDDQENREGREGDDPVTESQAIATGMQLARQITVPGQDRPENRKSVEGGVRSQHEDQRRDDGDIEEAERPVPEDRGGHLRDDRTLRPGCTDEIRRVLRYVDIRDHRQDGDATEHGDRDQSHRQQRPRRVAALGWAERRYPVTDRLHTGKCGTAGGERPQRQEDGGKAAEGGLGVHLIIRALGPGRVPERGLQQPDRDHHHDADDEAVRRERERRARLPDTAQIDYRQDDDQHHGNEHLVAGQAGQGRREVGDPGGNRHRDREDVVDEQRARGREADPRPQVRHRDLVSAAPGGVGAHVLAVGGDDGQQHHDDRARHPRRKVVEGQTTERQDKQDLLGGIRHRGQRVAAENRQGDPLRQQRLAELVAPEGATDETALEAVREPHAAMLPTDVTGIASL